MARRRRRRALTKRRRSDPAAGSPAAGATGSSGAWRVRPETLAALKRLHVEDGAAAPTNGSARPDDRRATAGACRLLAAYLSEILGREVPSAGPFVEHCLKSESPVSGG